MEQESVNPAIDSILTEQRLKNIVYPARLFRARLNEEFLRANRTRKPFIFIQIYAHQFDLLGWAWPNQTVEQTWRISLLTMFSHLRFIDVIGYLSDGNGIGIILPDIPLNPDYGREATLIEGICFESIRMTDIHLYPLLAQISPSERTLVNAVRDIRFSNVHASAPRFPFVEGRAACPFRDFAFHNCSFRRVPVPPSDSGPSAPGNNYPESFRFAKGFVLDNVRFDASE